MDSFNIGAIKIVATVFIIMLPIMLWDVTREPQPTVIVVENHEYIKLGRAMTHSASCSYCEEKQLEDD